MMHPLNKLADQQIKDFERRALMPTEVNQIQMLDIARPDNVEVTFSENRNTLWVNVDGICRLRVTGLAVVDAYSDLHLGDTNK